MPAKKDAAQTVERKASAAHVDATMDPEVEARRSGPPAGTPDRPDRDLGPAVHSTDPNVSEMIAAIDELLKDPDFDTSGKYRERLAALTRGQSAPTM